MEVRRCKQPAESPEGQKEGSMKNARKLMTAGRYAEGGYKIEKYPDHTRAVFVGVATNSGQKPHNVQILLDTEAFLAEVSTVFADRLTLKALPKVTPAPVTIDVEPVTPTAPSAPQVTEGATLALPEGEPPVEG